MTRRRRTSPVETMWTMFGVFAIAGTAVYLLLVMFGITPRY